MDKPMKLVKMEALGDCGPACVAMVLGTTLADAKRMLGDCSRGCSAERVINCLAEEGLPSIESLIWPSYRIPAILTVPSLNHPGLLHYIVWDGAQYLDPSHEKRKYPQDGAALGDDLLAPYWSSAILLFTNAREV